MSKEDAGNGLNVEFLESIADGTRKATNAAFAPASSL